MHVCMYVDMIMRWIGLWYMYMLWLIIWYQLEHKVLFLLKYAFLQTFREKVPKFIPPCINNILLDFAENEIETMREHNSLFVSHFTIRQCHVACSFHLVFNECNVCSMSKFLSMNSCQLLWTFV